jgi:hypothetical protein
MTKLSVDRLLALLSRIAHALEVIAKKLSPNFKPVRKPEFWMAAEKAPAFQSPAKPSH